MKKRVESLIGMQKCDDKISEKEHLKDELPKQLQSLIAEEAEAKIAVVETIEEINQVLILQKDKELVIKQNKDKAARYEEQLATIKTNKEYKALNSEIALLSSQNSELESEIISLMEQENQLKTVKAEKEKTLKEKTANLVAKEDVLKKEIAGLDGEIDKLKAKRNAIAVDLPRQIIKQYKILIINRNRKAVAFEKDGACSACGFKVRPQVIIELEKENKTLFCENCSRFLVRKPLF
ncbi:MAG: C4-type zinc ribbon domain-containing protein [Candidatus Cloacimonadales bacterium]